MATGEIITTEELFANEEPEVISTEELFASPEIASTEDLFSDATGPTPALQDGQEVMTSPGVPIPPEALEQFAQEQFEEEYALARGKRGLQTKAIRGLPKKDQTSQIFQLSPIHLLEAASDLNPVTDFSTRRDVVNMLEAKGIPKSAIEDFVIAEKGPEGVQGFLKKEAIPLTGEIAGGIIGQKTGKPIRGAAAGRAVGEVIQRAGERIFITERQKTIGQDIKEGSVDSAAAAVGDWGSRKAVGIVGAILKPAGKTRIAGAEGLQKTLREAGRKSHCWRHTSNSRGISTA